MKALAVTVAAACTAVFAQGVMAQTPPVSPVTLVDQFEATNGKFEGYRRSGAKGICAAGEFVASDAARGLSTASVFSGKAIRVGVRFSVGGANPKAADNGKSQRNMALPFNMPDGEQWLMGNINSPVFGASSPEQMLDLVASRQPDPATGTADAAKVKAFNDAKPEVLL